jgi:phospholipid/cholesterol/gamma-HCH transport system substrate-binding protein
MRNSRWNYVAVGLFVLAMVGAGLAGLVVVGARTGSTDSYYVVLDNVADIKFGTQVRYEGYPVGQVDSITPDAHGGGMRFKVGVSVAEGWQIPSDSVARIGSTSFLAAKTLDITRGSSAQALEPGMEIAGAQPVDVFAAMSEVAAEISDLSRTRVQPLLANIDHLVTGLGGTVEQDVGELLATLNGLAGTLAEDTPRITATLKEFSDKLNASATTAATILSPENATAIQRVVGNVDQTADRFAALSASLQLTADRVDTIIDQVDSLVADNRAGVEKSLTDLRYTLRTVAQNVDTIVHNMEGTSRNMNEFSRLIRQNPGLLLGGTPRREVTPDSVRREAAAQ